MYKDLDNDFKADTSLKNVGYAINQNLVLCVFNIFTESGFYLLLAPLPCKAIQYNILSGSSTISKITKFSAL